VYQLKGDAAGSSMHLKEKHSSAVVSFVHPKFLESRDKLPQRAWRLLLNLVYLSYEDFVVCGIVVYALPISALCFRLNEYGTAASVFLPASSRLHRTVINTCQEHATPLQTSASFAAVGQI
jgi:hypothetical protein